MVAVLGVATILLAGAALLLFSSLRQSTGNSTSANSREKISGALRHYQAGDLDSARRVLIQVDLENECSAEGWQLAGMLEEAVGNSRSALALYTKALAVTPSAALYLHRARLFRQRGDYVPAMSDMELAANRAPTDIAISNERLLLLIQAGCEGKASAEIKRLRELAGSGNADGWIFGLCGLALQNGEYLEAQKILSVAEASVPSQIFERMLKDPVIVRHMSRPEITAFYLKNLKK